MFHKHKWIEVERFYAMPRDFKNLSGGPPEMTQQMLLGVTTIRYECVCTASKTEIILGKSTKK